MWGKTADPRGTLERWRPDSMTLLGHYDPEVGFGWPLPWVRLRLTTTMSSAMSGLPTPSMWVVMFDNCTQSTLDSLRPMVYTCTAVNCLHFPLFYSANYDLVFTLLSVRYRTMFSVSLFSQTTRTVNPTLSYKTVYRSLYPRSVVFIYYYLRLRLFCLLFHCSFDVRIIRWKFVYAKNENKLMKLICHCLLLLRNNLFWDDVIIGWADRLGISRT